jgi:hypothetical protein
MELSEHNAKRLAQVSVNTAIIVRPESDSEKHLLRFDEHEVPAMNELEGYRVVWRNRRWWVNRFVVDAVMLRRVA